jgi:hypothetical protein
MLDKYNISYLSLPYYNAHCKKIVNYTRKETVLGRGRFLGREGNVSELTHTL